MIIKSLNMNQDPFIIIKNYRTRHYNESDEELTPVKAELPIKSERIALRQLDSGSLGQLNSGSLGSRNVAEMKKKVSEYREEDKENFIWLDDSEKCSMVMSCLPNPNQAKLINYADYDVGF